MRIYRTGNTATLISEEDFNYGIESMPPVTYGTNRHVVGEPYADTIDGETLWCCQYRFKTARGDVYFQCLMTLEEYQRADAIKFRRERIPACHSLHIQSMRHEIKEGSSSEAA